MYAVASASAIGDSLSADCVLRTSSMRPTQAWALTIALIPPIVVFLWFVVFGLASVCSKKKIQYLKVHFPVAVIVTLLFAHPVVTKSAIKLTACRTIAGRNFLDADFNVSCDSEEYMAWTEGVAIPILIFYTFGVPLAYAVAMYRHVRQGTLQTHRDIYGFFFSGFRQDIWWFELWNTLRKSMFTISAVLFAPAGVMMQTWSALVLLLFYVAVFLIAKPYDKPYLNHLERNALSINVVTLLLGVGLFTNDRSGVDAKSDTLAELITVAILASNIFFVLNVGWTLSKHTQYCKCCKKKRSLAVNVVPVSNQTAADVQKTKIAALQWRQGVQLTLNNIMKKKKSIHTREAAPVLKKRLWLSMGHVKKAMVRSSVLKIRENHDKGVKIFHQHMATRQKNAGQRMKQRLLARSMLARSKTRNTKIKVGSASGIEVAEKQKSKAVKDEIEQIRVLLKTKCRDNKDKLRKIFEKGGKLKELDSGQKVWVLSKNKFSRLITKVVKNNVAITANFEACFEALWVVLRASMGTCTQKMKEVDVETATRWLFGEREKVAETGTNGAQDNM